MRRARARAVARGARRDRDVRAGHRARRRDGRARHRARRGAEGARAGSGGERAGRTRRRVDAQTAPRGDDRDRPASVM